MKFGNQNLIVLALGLTLSTLLCTNHPTLAQSSEPVSRNQGGLTGIAGEIVNNTLNGTVGNSKNGNENGGNSSPNQGSSNGSSLMSSLNMFGDSQGSSTPKPDSGMMDRVKDMFREDKDSSRNSSNDKGDSRRSGELSSSNNQTQSSPINLSGSSNNQTSGSSSNQQQQQQQQSGNNSSSLSTTQSPSLPMDSNSTSTTTTSKPSGGLMNMMSDMAKKGKDVISNVIEPSKKNENNGSRNGLENESGVKDTGKEGPIDKMTKLVGKGTEALKERVHKIEDVAKGVGEKVTKVLDDHVVKPMQSTSGSGQQNSEGQLTPQATANAQLRGSEKEKHLIDLKKKQEAELGTNKTAVNLKDIVNEAKSRGVIPQNEDRSVLRGNHDDEKSLAVEVFDKAHEISKIPVEKVLKPIDKMLGYEKDPLLRMYDNSHELLRKPLEMMTRPVESVLTGAFKTSDEAKRDSEKLLATSSEQDRKESKMMEEKMKKENRTIAGQIADKSLDLALKPFEIVLKPFDNLLGVKSGKKNPLLHLIEEFYGLSKKPLDKVARPFESILKKMAEEDQSYQIAIRFNADKDDPKLFTRLADGYLNVADRVMTKPLELFIKPLDHVLGFDEPGKKNPILEAAHSLKNATKVGVELFTKPIDRIIKDIADIGAFKNESEREAFFLSQKEEASRLVKVLDKMHELAQAPFEIILRPVAKAMGKHKEGRKEPLLRAWDIIHQVVRTPIQVISKPVEDAILGEKHRKPKNGSDAQSRGALTSMIAGGLTGLAKNRLESKAESKAESTTNVFIDKIKKVEKFAARPFEAITAPIRRMILGEDNEKVGSDTEKNNREIANKAKAGDKQTQSKSDSKSGGGKDQPDKIMSTLEKMNNVMLKPLEVITQPLADILSSEKGENKMDKLKQQQPSPPPPQKQEQSDKNQSQAPASFQARAQAAQKKN